MTSCTQVLNWLPCFVGDDLDVETASAVRAHLLDCVACRREAAALQQSTKALRSLREAGAPGVDDAAFASMHTAILAAVDRAEAETGRWSGWRLPRWLASAAAAVLLFGVGWHLMREDDAPWGDRRGFSVSFDHAGPAKAVPWSDGGHVQLRPLGDDGASDNADRDAEGTVGPGMMGRWRLRTLEEVGFLEDDVPLGVDLPVARPDAGAPRKVGASTKDVPGSGGR